MKLRVVATVPLVAAAVASGVVETSVITATRASATTPSPASCLANRPSRVGNLAGIVYALAPGAMSAANCRSRLSVATAGPVSSTQPPIAPNLGTPPLVNNGGSVMNGSGPVVITPIYWAPSGHSFPSTYQTLTDRFITDVAAASGSSTNVFSVLPQYESSGSLETTYSIASGTAITDTRTYPTNGCTPDTGAVYPDNSTYGSCLTDAQLQAELTNELTTGKLSNDVHHLYMLFLPKGVETCFTSANGAASGNCSPNHPGVKYSFCGYHGAVALNTSVYAVMPYAVTGGQTGASCSSMYVKFFDGTTPVGTQSPNGDLDSDTVISVMSHEMSEAITDPNPFNNTTA